MKRKTAAKKQKKRMSPKASTTLFHPRAEVFFAFPNKDDHSLSSLGLPNLFSP
jgi:hypothetical protein